MTTHTEQSTYLFMTEGSSDKEYHAHLRAQGDGWVVQYANGPRGRVGKTAMKTAAPLSYEEALKVYADLVKSKTKKGYTEAESGVRFTNTGMQQQASGHAQQLPTAIDRTQAELLLRNPDFAAQEKANGERCSIEVRDGVARGINKLGLYRDLPENVASSISAFGNAFFDGEIIGTVFHAFDLLEINGADLRRLSFRQRYELLDGALCMAPADSPIRRLHASISEDGKREKFTRIEQDNGEGLVFKRLSAPYDGGRSDAALKFKFNESASCIVTGLNGGRSASIGLLDPTGATIPVGNVTILANFPMPAVGDLVEVQYLYFNPGGAFEQPVYLGPREDIKLSECVISQVNRLKPGVAMDAMGRRVEASPGAVSRPRM